MIGPLLMLAGLAPTGLADAPGTLYVTTPILEPDRCATAWVIARYVDPAARFAFFERTDLPDDAVRFDLPEAALRRDARRATVEVLVAREGVADPFVARLARIVHDIEINSWARRHEPGSRQFEDLLMETFARARSPERGLERCFALLDSLRASGRGLERWVEEQRREHRPAS
jgi:hypothetical protein